MTVKENLYKCVHCDAEFPTYAEIKIHDAICYNALDPHAQGFEVWNGYVGKDDKDDQEVVDGGPK